MLNMGVQVEICAREVVWMMNNNEKPTKFRDILYYLNVIFLQRVFEALKSIFSYSKIMRLEFTKVHSIFVSQIKELREIFLMV
jgi:hypothetical protein